MTGLSGRRRRCESSSRLAELSDDLQSSEQDKSECMYTTYQVVWATQRSSSSRSPMHHMRSLFKPDVMLAPPTLVTRRLAACRRILLLQRTDRETSRSAENECTHRNQMTTYQVASNESTQCTFVLGVNWRR